MFWKDQTALVFPDALFMDAELRYAAVAVIMS